MSSANVTEPYQFDVMRLTGVQIFRRLPLTHLPPALQERIWKAAPPPPLGTTSERQASAGKAERNRPAGAAPHVNDMIPVIRDFIACDEPGAVKCSDWIACAPHEGVFFRLLRIGAGSQLAADLVIDTQTGAGRMEDNLIHCLIPVRHWLRKIYHPIAQFHVVANDDVKNARHGSLIMDFGNTATCFIFADQDLKPQLATPIELHNPFDPRDASRPADEKQMFRSTAVLLRIRENASVNPWLLLGKSAEERIQTIDPHVTSLWAPKKHIRDQPGREIAIHCRGVDGRQRVTPQTCLSFVKLVIEQMLALTLSAQMNPHFGSKYPEKNPKVMEVLFTYPLTWRQQEIELFRRMVEEAARRIFVLPAANSAQFRVHPVCSEPVAVAAYVLWNVFFQFHGLLPEGKALLKPSLASNLLGNTDGDQDVTLLIVDVGGGSTDIALVKANWVVVNDPVKGTVVDVHTQVIESLRYARAGDRLSHLIATALLEYVTAKYNVVESLDFNQKPTRAHFVPEYKRAAISELDKLVERVKAFLATKPGETWVISAEEEAGLLAHLQAARANDRQNAVTFRGISLAVVRDWIKQDHAANSPSAEPGLMDIFFDLHQLGQRARENGCFPHLVLLSGRTTRLSLFKSLLMEHLKIPAHRVRSIKDILPTGLPGQNVDNIDKFAVVQGAHRFKFGPPIQFIHHPTPQHFRRHIGTLESRHTGWELTRVLVEAGKAGTQTHVVNVPAHNLVRIGHAFQKDSARAELIAVVENLTNEPLDVKLDFIDDYHVELNQHFTHELQARFPNTNPVRLIEHLPGGDDVVDNYCDTGKIDRHLRSIVQKNRADWMEAP